MIRTINALLHAVGLDASLIGTLLLSLSTIAGTEISNPSWVNFQSAGWVSFQSAPTGKPSNGAASVIDFNGHATDALLTSTYLDPEMHILTLRIALRHIPEAGAVCGSSARTDLCGGRQVTAVPTATQQSAIRPRSIFNRQGRFSISGTSQREFRLKLADGTVVKHTFEGEEYQKWCSSFLKGGQVVNP